MFFVIVLMICLCRVTYAAENDTQLIAQKELPSEIIGKIANYFNIIIGTTPFKNYADILVVAKNIRALTCTNKKNYKAINSPEVTKLLIEGIAKRFDISHEQAAANLNTKGAREWLKATAHYLLFRTLQETCNFSTDIYLNIKQRTDDGFLLDANQDEHYGTLYTPWGSILRTKYHLKNTGTFYLANERFKRIVTKYTKTRHFECTTTKHYVYDKIIKINETDIPTPHTLYYQEAPEYTPLASIIEKTWNTLREIYHEKSTENAVPSSKNEIAEKNQNIEYLKNIDAISPWCALITDYLFQQKNGEEQKIFSLNSLNDCDLYQNIHSVTFQNNDDIPILLCNWEYFTQGHQNFVHDPHNIRLHNKNSCSICLNYETLCLAYTAVIQNLQTGWQSVKLADNPGIWFKQSEEEWVLFKNSKSQEQEIDALCPSKEIKIIKAIGQKCNFPDYALKVDNVWISENQTAVPGPLYLWVKKKYLPQFQEIFQFKFLPIQ